MAVVVFGHGWRRVGRAVVWSIVGDTVKWVAEDDMSESADDAARERDRVALRSRLVGIKLRTLVAEHLGVELGTSDEADQHPTAFPLGAALLHEGAAWVFLDGEASPRLGAALAWSLRNGADRVNVVAEDSTGLLARRAEGFRLPIDVWFAEGRSLMAAVPEPLNPPPNVPQHHEVFTATIEAAGVTPVHEFGVLVGEVRGLEVCRVVDDPATGATRLEVGVGAHDREAFQMMHGDVPTADSLARVADVAAQHRSVGAAPHPLNRLAAERLLRARVIAEPGLVGAVELAVESPPLPRANLKDPTPCVAFGHDADGTAVVVVCSTGVDLELIPYTVDARLAVQERRPGVVVGRTVVLTPMRDRIAITSLLADQLERHIELSSLEP